MEGSQKLEREVLKNMYKMSFSPEEVLEFSKVHLKS